MLNEKVAALLDSYEQDFVETVSRWVSVPSLKAAPAGENAPFGAEIRRMLDMAMGDGERCGFTVRDIDGYACDMTLGEGEDPLAVLGHLDVVPAGDGWVTPPFTATREGDKIFGRGTMDDKGSSLAAFYAMRAIKEAGIPLKRPIRMILGCDEETGWEDMAYYQAHVGLPDTGFSPDAGFPLINTEKGMLGFTLTAPAAGDGLRVKKMFIGERTNVIPGIAVCTVEGNEETLQQLKSFAAESGLDVTGTLQGSDLTITATGIAGHAAYPWDTRNAIGMLLMTLKALGVAGPIRVLADAVGMEHDGKSLGIACRDDLSGELTCNIGILHLENGIITATLDCRCPVTADLAALDASVRAHLPGFTYNSHTKAPHHVPAESELVTCLLAAYDEESGCCGKPESTGGGTYAKVLKHGVAFGAGFPDAPDLAHQAGEYLSITAMKKAMRIYANAMLRLCAR